MEERYIKSGFGKRTLSNDEHWIPLEVEGYRIYKPTIICLGGNGTIDSKKAKRFCAHVERMVNFKQEEQGSYRNYKYVDVVGFHYGVDNEFNEEGKKSDTGYFTKEYRDKIVDNLFLPLCIDSKGKKLPMNRIYKNWANVIVFTHCHGAKEIGQMMADLNYKLYKNGFKMDEIEKIMGYATHISYSPFTDENWLPCVRVQSFTDSLNRGLDTLYKQAYDEDLDGVSIKMDKAGEIRGKKYFASHQEVISVYAKQLLNNPELVNLARSVTAGDTKDIEPEKVDWVRNLKLRNQTTLGSGDSVTFDEHSFECLERNTDWSIANGSKCADVVSQIFARAFEIAFENAVINCYQRPIKLMVRPPMEVVYDELNDILKMFNPNELKSNLPKKKPVITMGD